MSKLIKQNPDIPESDLEGVGLETLAVRAGQHRTAELEHGEAIFPTSSFVYGSASQAAARFSGTEPGNIYSRFTNPTVRTFEERIAAMEGGERAVATASGMSAIMATCMALLQSGDQLVCSRGVFGTTTTLFSKYLGKFGVDTQYVDLTDLDQWRKAITPKTKLLFVETPSNPLGQVGDLEALAAIAHQAGALLVVDNCFCTPALQRPFQFGADLVIHSATKYLDGQGRCLGGVVVGPNALLEEIFAVLRTTGPTLSPFNAWIFSKGLETLGIRMRAHSASALTLARWLQTQPAIEQVLYAGLESDPGHALAKKQQSAFSGVLSFHVRASHGQSGQAAAWKFIDATRLISITANLGDTKSTITHPATTTHGRLSAEDKLRNGITDNLVRISVGLEEVADLQHDLQRGLDALS